MNLMKKSIIVSCFIFAGMVFSGEKSTNTNLQYLNCGEFDMKIAEVKIVDEVETKDGTVEAENRNNKLVEVKLVGKSTGGGLVIYKTADFSAIFDYRGFYKTVISRAVGVKPEIAPGEIINVMISSDDASMNNEISSVSKEELYVYFEIPKEVNEFQVQIPQVLKNSAKIE
ncbi:MAG: hypothetical protein JXR48_02940 [Candidatus Delongbacteria bacterium]|nr:hypothetical protein [Candidatus Delongbacteria bacterium]MBN2833904.1 hypothetical protein [Candidatus Delongbacteria bacterium]